MSQTNWKQCVWKRMIVEIVERSKKGNINKISNLFPISPLYEISLLFWTGVFLLFSCGCCSNQSVFIFSLQKSTFAHGFSRIPGLNGIPVVNLADAFETLYTGQFTLSVQLIKPNNPVIPLTDAVPQLQNYPLWISKGLAAFSCCLLLIKTLLSVISEKGVKLMNAITYFLNKARYYASLIRC